MSITALRFDGDAQSFFENPAFNYLRKLERRCIYRNGANAILNAAILLPKTLKTADPC